MKKMNGEPDGDKMASVILKFIKIHQRTTPARCLTYVRMNCRKNVSIQQVSKRMSIMEAKGIIRAVTIGGKKNTVYVIPEPGMADRNPNKPATEVD